MQSDDEKSRDIFPDLKSNSKTEPSTERRAADLPDLSVGFHGWMHSTILSRAESPVRNPHAYVLSAKKEFLENLDVELLEWAEKIVESYLDEKLFQRQVRGEQATVLEVDVTAHVNEEATKLELPLRANHVKAAIKTVSSLKGVTWSLPATEGGGKKIEPHEAAEIQTEIQSLMKEIDETDRKRQSAEWYEQDRLIDLRKKLVRRLYYLQRKLR